MIENNVTKNLLLHVLFLLLGIVFILSAILVRSRNESVSDLMINLGATFIATTLLSSLYQKFGINDLTEQIKEIQKTLPLTKKSLEQGIIDIWKERSEIPIPTWNEFTRYARHEVWICGVAGYGFANDGGFHQIVADGVARGCNYKILILDPESSYAKYWDEKEPTGVRPSKIRAALSLYPKLVEQNKGKRGKVEFRVYDEVPSLNIIRADERMFVTLYVSSQRGNDSLTLQIQGTRDGLFERYSKHFDRVWKTARVIAAT